MIVAQVTDPHVSIPGARLYGGYDPAVALRAVLARIDALFPRPDLVLFTGDLVELARREVAHALAVVLDKAREQDRADRHVDADAERVRAADHLQQPALREGLDEPPADGA